MCLAVEFNPKRFDDPGAVLKFAADISDKIEALLKPNLAVKPVIYNTIIAGRNPEMAQLWGRELSERAKSDSKHNGW
ncbi:hypothetical protein CAQUA_10225 [Corynebacterium aquatimens]|uniref:Uncharacterized protein n=1 Tax=Corynebacterium aquatimens TaxID=1190508 RepID=A0A931E296_9CORY|nr:hypothetical protein [Corynebacterium aquatimens]WJY66732.1 hypothetical protein CAQUA_10225 [Corynebacterium aquatimens]